MALEPPDMDLETRGVEALLAAEREALSSGGGGEDVAAMLQKAIAQYREFKSPRSESHLTVTMAEELKSSHKYR